MKDEDLTDEMPQDCKKFGVIDDNNRLTIPILRGLNQITQILNETGVLSIPKILTTEMLTDKKQTATVGYITRRSSD